MKAYGCLGNKSFQAKVTQTDRLYLPLYVTALTPIVPTYLLSMTVPTS